MSRRLPDIYITEAEKERNGKRWYKDFIDYAKDNHSHQSGRRKKLNRLYNSYNGMYDKKEFNYLNSTYGKENITKYIDYRLCRTKIDILTGEQLELPLQASIISINPNVTSQKLQDVYPLLGLHYAKKEVQKLREELNVDIYGGMEAPDISKMEDPISALSMKHQNEHYMQLLINNTVESNDFKAKVNDCFRDIAIASEAHFEITIKDYKLHIENISPDDALFEESDKDPFLQRSPYRGRRKLMYVHEILQEFDLNAEERQKLKDIENRFQSNQLEFGGNSPYTRSENRLMIEVYYVQWYAFKIIADKTEKGKNGKVYESDVTNYINKNVKNHKKLSRLDRVGKIKLNKKYKKTVYEGVCIGEDIYVNMREKENNPFRYMDPTWTQMDYVSLLFNTINGTRVSIKQLTEHIEKTYNLVMFQINREISKAKGKVLIYDEAARTKGKSMSDVMFNMTNDSIVTVNSSADGNIGQKDLQNLAGIKEVDLGVSQSVSQLISLKLDLQETADRITGILDSRMGLIPATQTATNAQQSLQSSRMVTGAVFYWFDQFVEKIIEAIIERYKTLSDVNPEVIESILGPAGLRFVQSTINLSMDDFAAKIVNPRREQAIRQMMDADMPYALQGGTMLPDDLLDYRMAQTNAEALAILKASRKKIEEMRRAEAEAAAAREDAALEKKLQAEAARTENMFGHTKENEILKNELGSIRDSQKAKDKAMLQQQANESKERIADKKSKPS